MQKEKEEEKEEDPEEIARRENEAYESTQKMKSGYKEEF